MQFENNFKVACFPHRGSYRITHSNLYFLLSDEFEHLDVNINSLKSNHFSGKSTEVGCLLQGIFPTQGLNLGLLYHRQMLYPWATGKAKKEWAILNCMIMPAMTRLAHCYLQEKHYLNETWSCCSITNSCLILCDPMDCSTPGSSVLHDLPEFTQIHVHWVSGAI